MSLVFVYGPDALQARMYDRIGPSEVIGSAILENHQLVFNKPNHKDPNEGLPNIQEAQDKSVFGVVYQLTDKQLEMLEGYLGGYGRVSKTVKLLDGNNMDVATWLARRTSSKLKPSNQTIAWTIEGAKQNQAPESILNELQQWQLPPRS